MSEELSPVPFNQKSVAEPLLSEEAAGGAGRAESRSTGRGPVVAVSVPDSSPDGLLRRALQSGAEGAGARASGEGEREEAPGAAACMWSG